MQALASDQPFNMLAEVNLKAQEYWNAKSSNYWRDLLAAERTRNERYLGTSGDSDWIAAFSPTGFDETWGIARGMFDLTRIPQDALSDLADGMARVLRYYDEIGIRSFNVVLFSSPFGEPSPHGAVIAKIASRYGFQMGNVNDVWGLRYFLDQSEVFDSPEDTATALRKHFA